VSIAHGDVGIYVSPQLLTCYKRQKLGEVLDKLVIIKPMELQERFFLMCDQATIGERGKISLFGIFEFFSVEKLPAVLPAASFAVSYTVKKLPRDREITFSLEILDPNGKNIIDKDVSLKRKYEAEKKSIGIIFNIRGLKFELLGNHDIVISANGNKISTTVLEIRQRGKK